MTNCLATLNVFERVCRPQKLTALCTKTVTLFRTELQSQGLAPATVARHMRALKVIARCAHRNGLLVEVPAFDMPKRSLGAQRMKGRPITTEEFERMLAATPGIVGEEAAESWLLLLRGLWASGLRLGEALALRWDHAPDCVQVDLDASIQAFDGSAQKSGRTELVPLAPEAVDLLSGYRRSGGYVFNPLRKDGTHSARNRQERGRVIGRIARLPASWSTRGRASSPPLTTCGALLASVGHVVRRRLNFES